MWGDGLHPTFEKPVWEEVQGQSKQKQDYAASSSYDPWNAQIPLGGGGPPIIVSPRVAELLKFLGTPSTWT